MTCSEAHIGFLVSLSIPDLTTHSVSTITVTCELELLELVTVDKHLFSELG